MRSEWIRPDQTGRPVSAFAYAKINLSLHVTGQRADGYHLLDSLVAFAGVHDLINVAASETLTLTVDGPMAPGVPVDDSNLVLKAARFLDGARGAAISLTKNLPASAGIGGGSADAAATLRALSCHWGLPVPDDLAALGADVPVCWSPTPQRMQGVGAFLSSVPTLPETWVVLVNPGVDLPTPSVFKALEHKNNPPMSDPIPGFETPQAFAIWLANQRNDLQAPAIRLRPVIQEVLTALDGALIARMSGSGATCFGLFDTADQADQVARHLRQSHPDWWVESGQLLRA
jgi:4-diphosphocytidyl-2-C-methyl-D-erythritol kinase